MWKNLETAALGEVAATSRSLGRVVVIGQGYVGLPLAMRAVDVGYCVVGLDLDQQRVDSLASGSSYVDDIPDATLKAALESGRYRPTIDYEHAANFCVAVITVPTPLRDTVPDLSFIESSAAALSPYISEGSTIVLESTTYPGTTEELLIPHLEAGSGLQAGKDFFVGYSPERIDPGNSEWGLVNTPKVVSGIDESSLAAVDRFYSSLVDRTVRVSSPREAELAKLLENTFRHVNIALVNELAMFANQLGVDVWEAIDAAATKPFGFMRFTPGPGVGGHCLPVDPSYLSWQVRRSLGRSFRFVELANDVNDHMPEYVVQRVIGLLNDRSRSIRGSRVLLVGVSYKKNSGDSREAPARRIIDVLRAYGADVVAADPHVPSKDWPPAIERVDLCAEEVQRADLAVIVTDHDRFDLNLLADSLVLDTRNSTTAANRYLL